MMHSLRWWVVGVWFISFFGFLMAEDTPSPPFPDQKQALAVHAPNGVTEAEAWSSLWYGWFTDRQRAVQAASDPASIWLEVANNIKRVAEDPLVPPVALAPAAQWLVGIKLVENRELKKVALIIARRMLNEPFGDHLRGDAAPADHLRSDSDAIRLAIEIADNCGGTEWDLAFYTEILASDRWRNDFSLGRIIQERFIRDKRLTSLWLAMVMKRPPEDWTSSTLRAVLHPHLESDEQRVIVLNRAIQIALTAVESAEALDVRARMLLDIASDDEQLWAGLLNEETLKIIEQSMDNIDDIRFSALPWLALLHDDVGRVRSLLASKASRIIAWTSRLNEHGLPVHGASINSKMAQEKPWTAAMPALPLALVKCTVGAPEIAFITRYQDMGVDQNGQEIRDQSGFDSILGRPELATKAAFAGLIAQDQEQLARWWSDEGVRFNLAGDYLFKEALAPWAVGQGIKGPWHIIPSKVNAPVHWMQYAAIMRAGASAESLEYLRASFTDKNPNTERFRQWVWSVVVANPALASELSLVDDALPKSLAVHPINHTADSNEAAKLVDLYLATGRRAKAIELASEAARLYHRAKIRKFTPYIGPGQPKLDSSISEATAATRLASEPWEWSAIDARLLLINPAGVELSLTLKKIAADTKPIGQFASWVIKVVSGFDAGPLSVSIYYSAARDSRFTSLMLTLALVPDKAAQYLPTLEDPFIMRGWCFGHPQHRWLGTQPAAKPIIEVLTAITILRLTHSKANDSHKLVIP